MGANCWRRRMVVVTRSSNKCSRAQQGGSDEEGVVATAEIVMADMSMNCKEIISAERGKLTRARPTYRSKSCWLSSSSWKQWRH